MRMALKRRYSTSFMYTWLPVAMSRVTLRTSPHTSSHAGRAQRTVTLELTKGPEGGAAREVAQGDKVCGAAS